MNIQNILSSAFDNIVPFVVLLGILVFVHELGHFLVARFCGVRVEVFSLGFGKKLLSYKYGDTVYCLSLIPLGGYVKMFGEQGSVDIAESDRAVSFTHKTVWQRIAIVLAGPLMNFFFAVLIFGFIAFNGEETRSARISEVQPSSVAEASGLKTQDKILQVAGQNVQTYEEFQKNLNRFQNSDVELTVQQNGEPERKVKVPVKSINNPNIFTTSSTIATIEGILPYTKGTLIAVQYDSLAYKVGLRTGDEIQRINNQKITSWSELGQLISNESLQIEVERAKLSDSNDKNSAAQKEKVTLTSLIDPTAKIQNLSEYGIENTDVYLDQVVPDSPAAAAGLVKYDKIINIDGQKISSWDDVLQKIKSYTGTDAITMTVLREGTEVTKKLTPKMTSQMTLQGKEDKRYTIGIVAMANIAMPELVVVSEKNPLMAIARGTERSWDISVMTVMSFVRLFQGEVSSKNIGGMISIGKAAKDSYQMGLQSFLMTMGILSISLFILNLLPVPVLDGGHLVFYVIEVIKGSPLSLRKIELAHQFGFALLMGLMALALFNDFSKFLF
jgi:regulator of sigma E protease